jgi:hypothetical protein
MHKKHPADFIRHNAQKREKNSFEICATFLLTNSVDCGIMEIRTFACVYGPPIIAHFLGFVNGQNAQKLRGVAPSQLDQGK